MTTTAHEDQFTVGTQPLEPVHQPYDIVSILRRNVADMEVALKQQTGRAEAAEAELLAIREDNHSMMQEIDGLRVERDALAAELTKLREQEPVAWCDPVEFRDDPWSFQGFRCRTNSYPTMPLYAAPIPAPAGPAAPSVPKKHEIEGQLSLAESEMINAKAWSAGNEAKRHIGFAMTAIGCARDLLQSADHPEQALEKVAPDCLACANRGRVNGLSQESYCDSCIYQGRDWRQNHFVDAVKRRCEACAILPCSCK